MILDAKSYIRQMNESYTDPVISDLPTIERIFKQASQNDSIVPGDDRDDMINRTENSMKNAVKNLLKCDIPSQLNKNILDSIDAIFEKYVSDYFDSFTTTTLADSYIYNYEDYDDFKTSVYDDRFWHIVEFFFEELAIYTHNAAIAVLVEDEELKLYAYYDPADDSESVYDNDWSTTGDAYYKDALPKTYDKLEEVFENVVNNNFEAEDWMSETERVFGGESGYWNYKGI